METILFILEFFGGLVLIFAVAWMMGKLLRLDEYYETFQQSKPRIQKKK